MKPQLKLSKTKVQPVLPYLAAFFISLVLGLCLFFVKDIYPFGDRNILCVDLWGQYFSMYVNNKQADGLSGLMYSWNGGFGFNNWSQSAYYCISIFLLLIKMIPIGSITKALGIFALLKMAFSAVTCLAYLRYKVQGKGALVLASAVSYSVCAYMLAYLPQLMWTDLLIYAPLIALGMEKLINEKKILLYAVSLAAALMSNFYIGYAVCIFCVVYFLSQGLVKLGITRDEENKRHLANGKAFVGAGIRFAVCSLIAGAMAAVFILPVVNTLSQTMASEMPFPEKFEWYGSLLNVLQEFADEQTAHVEYTGANLFAGAILFLSVPLYFVNRHFPLKERIANFIAVVFFLISLNCNYLNYIWHGFHFPNQLPSRWSFLLTLFVVMLSCKGLTAIRKMTTANTAIGCLAGLALFYAAIGGVSGGEKMELSGKALIFMLVLAAALILLSRVMNIRSEVPVDREVSLRSKVMHLKVTKKFLVTAVTVAVAALMIYDSGSNFVKVAQYEGAKGVMVSMDESYNKAVLKSCDYAEKWRSGEDDFYRVEANPGHTFNSSMLGDFHGMSYYSSTMNAGVYQFLQFLGNRVYADRVSSIYSISSPVQNSLFGVKYFMDFSRSLNNLVPDMTMLEESEEGNFFENPTALPLAYGISEQALSYEITDQVKAIQNQNLLVNELCGEIIDPFKPVPCEMTYENVSLLESDDWNVNYFSNESGLPTLFHYTLTAPTDGAYYMEHNFRAGKIHITGENIDKEMDSGSSRTMYIGKLAAGSVVQMDVTVENVGLGCFGLYTYKFDNEAWNNAYNKLNAQGLDVTHFENTEVTGTITMQQDGLVMATIPQDGGWSVYCDGREVETCTIADILLCAKIPAGEHTITYEYHVSGLMAGFLITLGALALLVLLVVLRKPLAKTFWQW